MRYGWFLTPAEPGHLLGRPPSTLCLCLEHRVRADQGLRTMESPEGLEPGNRVFLERQLASGIGEVCRLKAEPHDSARNTCSFYPCPQLPPDALGETMLGEGIGTSPYSDPLRTIGRPHRNFNPIRSCPALIEYRDQSPGKGTGCKTCLVERLKRLLIELLYRKVLGYLSWSHHPVFPAGKPVNNQPRLTEPRGQSFSWELRQLSQRPNSQPSEGCNEVLIWKCINCEPGQERNIIFDKQRRFGGESCGSPGRERALGNTQPPPRPLGDSIRHPFNERTFTSVVTKSALNGNEDKAGFDHLDLRHEVLDGDDDLLKVRCFESGVPFEHHCTGTQAFCLPARHTLRYTGATCLWICSQNTKPAGLLLNDKTGPIRWRVLPPERPFRPPHAKGSRHLPPPL